MSGARITLAATPIGNTEDASPRLRRALAEADLLAAEDTRRLKDLLRRLEVHTAAEIISLHDHNERARAEQVISAAQAGQQVVIVSDAGMPTISDPGYVVVREAVRAGLAVSAIPGPSAVLAALAVAALPTDRFTFEGFLPRKAGERGTALQALARERRTMVFFEAPHRLADTLQAMAEHFGAARPAAVCRELTKTYEEVVRGPLGELAQWAAGGVKGEMCVVVQGAEPDQVGAHAEEVVALAGLGVRLKDAARHVGQREGVSTNELYDAALQLRDAAN